MSFAADHVLVRFKVGSSALAQAHTLSTAGAVTRSVPLPGGYATFRTTKGATAALATMRHNPAVAWAGYDYIRTSSAVPNDPAIIAGLQNNLGATGFFDAWAKTQGSLSQVVAVVDTGVNGGHPDLAGRVLPGWNFVNGSSNAGDDNGHGTMVAGIAAANTNNGIGIAGAAWNARVLPVKVLDAQGQGADSEVSAGIQWAADHGATVINLSLGGPGDDPVLHSAVQYAVGKGVPVVVAAGNSGDNTTQYPAAYPEAIAVGATTSAGRIASFSTSGDWVDIAAPGVDITSTYLGQGYATGSGTSFAAPLVTGAVVLLKSLHPTWTPAQVAADLERSVDDAGYSEWDPYYGFGVLNAYSAVGGPRGSNPPNTNFQNRNVQFPAQAIAYQGPTNNIALGEGTKSWFTYQVPTDTAATVSVSLVGSTFEHDPQLVLDVYDQSRRLLAHSVAATPGVGLSLSTTFPAGTDLVEVSNVNGAMLGATLTITAQGPGVPPAPGLPVWIERATWDPSDSQGLGQSFVFDRALDASTVNATDVFARNGATGAAFPVSTTYDSATKTLSVDPVGPFPGGTTFDIFLAGIKDTVGNVMPELFWSNDHTSGTLAPVQALTATGGIGSASLAWTLPDQDVLSVVTRYAIGDIPPTWLGGAVGGDGFGVSTTVGGLQQGLDYSFSVWALGSSLSVGIAQAPPATATLSGTVVSLSSSPAATAYGGAVTTTATVTDATSHAPLPGRGVTIYWRVLGGTAWAPLHGGTTDANGQVSVVSGPHSNTQYEAVTIGGVGRIGAMSPVSTVPVAFFIGTRVSPTHLLLGQSALFSGALAPLVVGHPIQLQGRYHQAWVTLATAVTASTGRWALSFRPPARGTFGYRLYTPADATNTAGGTASIILVVS